MLLKGEYFSIDQKRKEKLLPGSKYLHQPDVQKLQVNYSWLRVQGGGPSGKEASLWAPKLSDIFPHPVRPAWPP